MTASTLLFYISVCLLGQVVLGIAYAAWRKGASQTTGRSPPPSLPAAHLSSAWSGLRAFTVVRREYEDATTTQCSFYLAPQDGKALPAFKPGQFLTFSLAVPGSQSPETRAVTRCYSLSDSPTPEHYRVTIKRVPAPAARPELAPGVSSTYFHDAVQVGDVLQMRAPSGHFYLDAESQAPVVLIAGGIGITPMVSMLRWCVQHQPQRLVYLYYGLRNGAEHAFKKVLEELAARAPQVHLHVVYSKPLASDTMAVDYQHLGHVDIALLQKSLPHGAHQFYVCGPPAMMESLVPALAQWGVASSDIHFEAFGPASVRLPGSPVAHVDSEAAPTFSINFQRSGRTLEWHGTESNLLDFAEKHGIAVESGCRSGSCGSCVTTIARGSVAYATPPDYDLAANQCLLCVGKPQSPLTLVA